jgi:hypothetical protein
MIGTNDRRAPELQRHAAVSAALHQSLKPSEPVLPLACSLLVRRW